MMRFGTLKTGERVTVKGERVAPLGYNGDLLGLIQNYPHLQNSLTFDEGEPRACEPKDLVTP